MALLIYLAAHPREDFPRSHLCALLWSDQSGIGARRNFNTMLSRLRHEIPVWPVRSEQDRLGWDRSADVAVDLAEVEERASSLFDFKVGEANSDHDGTIKGGARGGQAKLSLQTLRELAEAFQGSFCEGFYCGSNAFEEWLEQERSTWEVRALTIFRELVALEAADERWDRVLAYSRRALAIDYFQESFHRWLMTAHSIMGDRTLAIAHYEELCNTLMRELDAEPDPATTALVNRIKSQPEMAPPIRRPDPEPTALPAAVSFRLATSSMPLVGRASLLNEVLGSLAPQEIGEGAFVLLHGEAGIGKTRLVEEALRAILQPEGSRRLAKPFGAVLVGHCAPYGEDLSYAPIVECITRYLGQVDPASIDLSDVWWRQLARLAPDIALDSQIATPAPVQESQGPAEDRLGLLQAISRFIGALPPPVLIVVEDLHWADNATLEVLSFLLGPRHVGPHPTILATSRGDSFSPQFNETLIALERAGRAVRFALGPLSPGETRELVVHAAKGADLPLAQRIHDETGGNPLYVIELVRFLCEGNRLSEETATLGRLPIPPTVERVVAGRLSGLAPEAGDVLLAASIFPRGVTFSRLLSVSGLTEDQALKGFEALSRSGFVHCAGEGRIAFNHEIVRRAVAKSMSGLRRITLHRRAFHLLAGEAEGAAAGSIVDQLAYHAREGELWNEAVSWYQESARMAEAVFAYSTACRRLDQALACLEKSGAGPNQLETELRLRAWRLRLGYWFDPGRDESWRDALEEEGQATVAGQIPEVLLARAETLYLQGNMSKAEPILRRVLELIGPSGNPELRGYAIGGIGAVQMFQGDLRQAIDAFTESSALTETASRRLPGKSARLARAACYVLTGKFAQAESEIEKLASTETVSKDLSQAAYLHATEAMACYLQGRWDRAIAAARLGMEEARTAGHLHNEYYASIWLGAALAESGEVEAGLEALDRSANLADVAHTWIMLDWVHAFRGFAYLRSGVHGRAKEAAAEGLRLAERYGFKLGIGLCTEALGRVALERGDRTGAEEMLRQALRLYSSIGARPYFDRCRNFLIDFFPHSCNRNVTLM